MDKRLLRGGIVAIPLKQNKNHALNPQPNYIVLENWFGAVDAVLPVLGEVPCIQGIYKLVYREILPASPDKAEAIREIIYEHEEISIPSNMSHLLQKHNIVLNNLETVNMLFGLFSFRGVLADFRLEVDEVALDNILNAPPDEVTPSPLRTSTRVI